MNVQQSMLLYQDMIQFILHQDKSHEPILVIILTRTQTQTSNIIVVTPSYVYIMDEKGTVTNSLKSTSLTLTSCVGKQSTKQKDKDTVVFRSDREEHSFEILLEDLKILKNYVRTEENNFNC